MRLTALLLNSAILTLLWTTACRAATWMLMDTDGLVTHSELIISGKIVSSEGPPESQREAGRVGIIDVTDVIYGPAHVKRVRIMLESLRHGNNYRVGDEGTWFLRVRPEGASQEFPTHAPQRSAGGESSAWADAVFIAEHPASFWAQNDDFFVRSKSQRPGKDKEKQRLIELFAAVETRLERDVRRMAEALEEAKRNLAEVKRRRKAEAPGE